MNNKSILVTGGCGLIGSNFIKKLIIYNYDIVIIDNLSSGYIENLSRIKFFSKNKKNISYLKIDLNNKLKLEKVFRKHNFNYIFHFAAISNIQTSINNPKKILYNNFNTTKNLILLTKKYKVKYFVFSSSASVYGDVEFKSNLKETSSAQPISPYGVSKLKCENFIKKNSINSYFNFCIFRYFNVVGNHLSKKIIKKKNLNLFEKINYCIKENKLFKIYGNNLKTPDGTPVRDFIHIDDIVSAHLLCLNKNKTNFWNNIYNIGYNNGVTVFQIVLEFKKIFKKKLKFKFVNKKKGEIEKSIANNQKLLKNTKWKPKFVNINKMIRSYYINSK